MSRGDRQQAIEASPCLPRASAARIDDCQVQQRLWIIRVDGVIYLQQTQVPSPLFLSQRRIAISDMVDLHFAEFHVVADLRGPGMQLLMDTATPGDRWTAQEQ